MASAMDVAGLLPSLFLPLHPYVFSSLLFLVSFVFCRSRRQGLWFDPLHPPVFLVYLKVRSLTTEGDNPRYLKVKSLATEIENPTRCLLSRGQRVWDPGGGTIEGCTLLRHRNSRRTKGGYYCWSIWGIAFLCNKDRYGSLDWLLVWYPLMYWLRFWILGRLIRSDYCIFATLVRGLTFIWSTKQSRHSRVHERRVRFDAPGHILEPGVTPTCNSFRQ